jgi:cell division protein ZapA
MSEARGVDINIMGREFTISCTDEERASLIDAVNYLDKKMRDIRDSGKIVGTERIAVMAALNVTYELLNASNGKFDIGDFKRRIGSMQARIDEALAEQGRLI